MSARTTLITGHLTARQARTNPRSRSYQPVGICLVFSVFLSYKTVTHSAVVRPLLILLVKRFSLMLGTMPMKRRQISPNNKISSEKDVPGRVISLRWASGLRVSVSFVATVMSLGQVSHCRGVHGTVEHQGLLLHQPAVHSQ